MATYDWGLDRTFKAAIDLSASQYSFVIAGSIAGECTLATTTGGSVIGVLQNKPRATEGATVRVLGFSKVRAQSSAGASPLTWGGFVKAGSDGCAWGCGVQATAASTFSAGISYDAYATSTGCVMAEIFVQPHSVRSY